MIYVKDTVLPSAYGENTMVLLAREPETVFVYWELSEQLREAVADCSEIYLRLHRVEEDESGHRPVLETEVIPPPYTRNWYFGNLPPGKIYYCDMGCKRGDYFFSIITSNAVSSPPVPAEALQDFRPAKVREEDMEIVLVNPGGGEKPDGIVNIKLQKVYQTMPFYMGLFKTNTPPK